MKKSHYFLLIFVVMLCCIALHASYAQLRYRVLFLGNSYTSVNNLPQMVKDAALSAGDTLIFDMHAPGGYQLNDHTSDPVSQAKIMAGSWDYVIIQGQSQEPITLLSQFNNGGLNLYNQVKQYNPCAVTVPYMTWGRKNGDASNCVAFPDMCTYQGMDTTLRNRYLSLTATLNGEVAPVGVVWNYLRNTHPDIELYQADESHPSAAGSYAAACCFYSLLFKKDPTLITFNYGLSVSQAIRIRNAVKTKVYDSLHLWDYKRRPVSAFNYQVGAGINEVTFNPLHAGTRQYYSWDFGDGTTATVSNPTHTYSADGTYTVSLTTTNCDLQGVHTSTTDTVIQFCSHTPTIFTSHAWLCRYDTLWTQQADMYQWFLNSLPLPETGHYLANYARYGLTEFSVKATVNGCSELSRVYTRTAEYSGYYFDAIGDPCAGDTVTFAVLHINSFLPGGEHILWYKNDTLLASMTNKDTLLITTGGIYTCKVSNPNALCPLDTTAFTLEYDCDGATGTVETGKVQTLTPNPASTVLSISFAALPVREELLIYSALGRLERSVPVVAITMHLDISGLAPGLYYIRLKNLTGVASRFIKL